MQFAYSKNPHSAELVVPVVVVESDDSLALPKLADQVFAAVFVHVTWTVFAVPSES